MEKYCVTGQAAVCNMARALWMLDTQGYRHTLRICKTYCFCIATMGVYTCILSSKKKCALYIYHPGLMWHWNDKFFDYAVCGNICRIRQWSAEVKLFVQYMPIIVQQGVTMCGLFIAVNRSACFGRYLHPSPGAHVTVSSASGISNTVTATCRERDWMGVPIQSRLVWQLLAYISRCTDTWM